MDVTHGPELSSSSFLRLDQYKFFFYRGHTSLWWNYTTCYNPPISLLYNNENT